MLPTYPYATCRLNIVSTSANTVFGCVADMLANMSATCQADTHVSVDSTIFLTFKNLTFPAKENTPPLPSFPSIKRQNTQNTLIKLRGCVNWGY